jgi:hypothetical protein
LIVIPNAVTDFPSMFNLKEREIPQQTIASERQFFLPPGLFSHDKKP